MRSQRTARIPSWSRLRSDRHCHDCQEIFQLSRYHPRQLVCSRPDWKRQRRREYHRRKLHTDAEFHQFCRDSQQKWRNRHPDYPRQGGKGGREEIVGFPAWAECGELMLAA